MPHNIPGKNPTTKQPNLITHKNSVPKTMPVFANFRYWQITHYINISEIGQTQITNNKLEKTKKKTKKTTPKKQRNPKRLARSDTPSKIKKSNPHYTRASHNAHLGPRVQVCIRCLHDEVGTIRPTGRAGQKQGWLGQALAVKQE